MIIAYIILGLFVLLWIVPNFLLTKHQKEDVKNEMKRKYPNGAAKPHYDYFPLNMYNDLF